MDLYNNWWEEKRSAYMYSVMAATENNLLHKKLFSNLREAAEKQALIWEQRMRNQQITAPAEFTPDFRTRIIASLIKLFGAERLHNMLAAMKIRGMSVFTQYHKEHKHTSIGATSNLRAAVFGVNDGLVSNMSLILGVAGANADYRFIILTGIAGLLSGACSMGAGEYISVRSQREIFEYQIEIERQELEEYPEEEKEELSLIYQARGIPEAEAIKLANIMIDNPETGLNALAREELGINPDDLVSPIGAMISSFISFAIGAIIPLIPFFFGYHSYSLIYSMALTGGALFLIGASLSLLINANPWWQGTRMLLIATAAGSLTYGIGTIMGIAIH